LADVQSGFGAFVAFYLAESNWSQENVGLALTIGRHACGGYIAAMRLGIVGRRAVSSRTGRNERFQGAGNALTALLGLFGSYVGKTTIFLATTAMTIPALIALSFIRSGEIDLARTQRGKGRNLPPLALLKLWKNPQLLWFACCLALFFLCAATPSGIFPIPDRAMKISKTMRTSAATLQTQGAWPSSISQ
jgi:hypothetical protein